MEEVALTAGAAGLLGRLCLDGRMPAHSLFDVRLLHTVVDSSPLPVATGPVSRHVPVKEVPDIFWD